MKLLLDTSVLLAASHSPTGASRAICDQAAHQGWILLSTNWILREVASNLTKFPPAASREWKRIQASLQNQPDVVSLDRPLVYPATKDRPVLISAIAWADVLLTLDRDDFMDLLGSSCYGLQILTPSDFFRKERSAGRLK